MEDYMVGTTFVMFFNGTSVLIHKRAQITIILTQKCIGSHEPVLTPYNNVIK